MPGKTTLYLIFLLIVTGNTSQTLLQPLDRPESPVHRFPAKIEYTVYKDNYPMGKANLFFSSDTGLTQFDRQLSSLRLVLFQEKESDFQYLYESYLFKDNLSLYSDSLVKKGGITISRFQLEPIPQGGNNKATPATFIKNSNRKSYFTHKTNTTQPPQEHYLLNNNRDMSRLSFLLAATEKVKTIDHPKSSSQKEEFNYFSSNLTGKVEMAYKGIELFRLQAKKISLHVFTLQGSQGDIHYCKIATGPAGNYYPASIIFNANDQRRRLELRSEKRPSFAPPKKMEKWPAIFLDFVNITGPDEKKDTKTTGTGEVSTMSSPGATSSKHTMILGTIRQEITQNLKRIGTSKGKSLQLVENTQNTTVPGIEKFIDTIFDEFLPPQQRIARIFKMYHIPSQVDIVVAGQYIDNPFNRWLMVRPIIIIKSTQTILTRNLLFKKDEITCTGTAANRGRKTICSQAHDYIAYKLNSYFSVLDGAGKTPGLTIEDAYRMIIKNGFFCHSTDYGYHAQVLERLRKIDKIEELENVIATSPTAIPTPGQASVGVPGSSNRPDVTYTFQPRRNQLKERPPGKKLVLKTQSINANNPADNIELTWAPLAGGIRTYAEAQSAVKELNKKRYQGYTDWRLPTLEELMSIAQLDKKRQVFFPFLFPSPDIKIWTTTQLEEMERKHLVHCEQEVYFIVDCSFSSPQPRLQFDVQCPGYSAYMVPVRSSNNPTSPTVAGSNYMHEQPGSRRILPPNTSRRKRLYISNLTILKADDRMPMASGGLAEALNREVLKGMQTVVAANKQLTIDEQSRRMFFSDDNANSLTNILFDPVLTKEEKIDRIVQEMLQPNHMDIVITGLFIEEERTGTVTVRPVLINGTSRQMQVKNLQFKRDQFIDQESAGSQGKLQPQAAQQIAQAVQELLAQA